MIKIRLGEHTLDAVCERRREYQLKTAKNILKVVSTGEPQLVTLDIAGRTRTFTVGDQFDELLSTPLLMENDRVAIYASGSSQTLVNVYPNPGSAQLKKETVGRISFSHYEITYRNAIGDVKWIWRTPRAEIEITLECFPSKMDYKTDFQQIRKELERLSPSLLASPWGHTSLPYGATSERLQQSEVEWLSAVRRNLDELAVSTSQLLPRLRRQLRSSYRPVHGGRLRNSRPVSRRQYANVRSRASVLVSDLSESQNIAINAYMKAELEGLLKRAEHIVAAEWFVRLDQDTMECVLEVRDRCREWLRELTAVKPTYVVPDLAIRMRDPFYARQFRVVRSLKEALDPLGRMYPVSVKDLPTLYEYWVFLAVVEILKEICTPVGDVVDPACYVSNGNLLLASGAASRMKFLTPEGAEICCHYNRKFSSLPTTNQRPDAFVEIDSGRGSLVVDAKYRVGNGASYLQKFGLPGPLEEDINVIHRYRDAIVHFAPPYRKISRAGIIAFPGRVTQRYRAHKLFRSWYAVSVAGVPFLPDNTSLMKELICMHLVGQRGGSIE